LTKREGRKFAFTVGLAFCVLTAISWWRGHVPVAGTLGALGVGLLLAGAVAPTRLGPVQSAWMSLAHAISKVTTPVFMGVVYFLVLTPTGLVMRALGRRPLRRELDDGSYWIAKRRDRGGVSDMNRQF
jgi:hypothetical protein